MLTGSVGKNRDTSGGPRRLPGQAAPLYINNLLQRDDSCGAVAPMAYTDMLGTVAFLAGGLQTGFTKIDRLLLIFIF